jgi:hypothetical protein
MQSTQNSTARLATRRIDEAPLSGKGYRATALMERLSTRKVRHEAAEKLCDRAERKPTWLYDYRKDQSRTLPCERLDAAITHGISEGWITPEGLADYFGDLYALYRAMMPGAAEATYIDTTREKAEALDATARARALNTPEACAHAVKELSEDVIVSLAHAKQLQRGGAA